MRRQEIMRTKLLGGVLLLLGLLVAAFSSIACESEGIPVPQEIVSLLARASFVSYRGECHYENRYDGVAKGITESVANDGKGGISSQLLALDGLDARAFSEKFGEEAWKTAQAKYGLFSWHSSVMRGFRVQDPALFSQNYRLLEMPTTGRWMDKETIELVLGRSASGRRYELSLDKEKGVALRVEEKSSAGEALSRLQFHSIRYDEAQIADGDSGKIKRPAELPLGADPSWKEAAPLLGFAPYVPHDLPEGFQRVEAKILTAGDGSRSFLDAFTDGVEVIAVRQRIQPFSIVFSQEELDAVKAQGEAPARRFAYGPVTVIEAYSGDLLISVVGKLDPGKMLSFVESFAPAQ